jgi:hypothetical protein
LQAPENTTRRGGAAGRQHPRELAARDDVEAGAARRQRAEHGQVAVRLDGVADPRRVAGEGVAGRRRSGISSAARE